MWHKWPQRDTQGTVELHLGADGDITVHGIMFPHTLLPMRSPVPRSLDTLFPLPAGSCAGAAVGGTCDRLEGKREAEATVFQGVTGSCWSWKAAKGHSCTGCCQGSSSRQPRVWGGRHVSAGHGGDGVAISAGHGRRVGWGHTLVDITVGGTQQAIGGYNSFPSGPHWWVIQPFLFAPSSFMAIL